MSQQREGQAKATSHVLEHVERAKESLVNIRGDRVTADGVFIHPQMQFVSLKVAREELNKAIVLMERTVRLHMLCDSREAFVNGGSGSVSVSS